MTEHLLSCTQCPYDIKNGFKDAKPTSKKSGPSISSTPVREVSRESTSNSIELQTSPSQTQSSVQISEHVDDSTDKIDAALARAAYCSSLPLSAFESTYWKNALHLLKPNYKAPNKYVMSNALLDGEYYRVKSNIDEKIKRALALGLVTDGWTNICGRSVINFIITTPEPIFHRSIYPGREKETAAYINAQVVEVIREVGPEKFVAVITDNASNMRAAWRQIQAEYPHIDCIGCAAHSLNLLFGDIMKIECFNKVFQQCKKIIKYITKRHVHLAVFEEKQKQKYGSQSSTLKLPSKTRWAGAILTFQSFLANREALEAFAISQDLQIDRNIKTDILSDFFWTNLKVLEEILSPISNEIHHIESDSGLLSKFQWHFRQ